MKYLTIVLSRLEDGDTKVKMEFHQDVAGAELGAVLVKTAMSLFKAAERTGLSQDDIDRLISGRLISGDEVAKGAKK